jgi:hypothetical protein
MDSDESIERFSQNDMLGINEDIQELEKNELLKKREANHYDLLGLRKETHEFYQRIHEIRE